MEQKHLSHGAPPAAPTSWQQFASVLTAGAETECLWTDIKQADSAGACWVNPCTQHPAAGSCKHGATVTPGGHSRTGASLSLSPFLPLSLSFSLPPHLSLSLSLSHSLSVRYVLGAKCESFCRTFIFTLGASQAKQTNTLC